MMHSRKAQEWIRFILVLPACLLLTLVTTSCGTIDAVTGERVYNLYTVEDDVELGRSTLQSNTKQMQESGVKVNADEARVAQLREMVERISAVSDMPELPFEVTLFHTNIVNAAAAPGGSMLVFEGLYNSKEAMVYNENEMAAVMAHEIAHVTCRHVTERISKLMTAAALTEVAAVVIAHNDEQEAANILRGAFAVGTALYIPSYTRKDEAEADRIGLFYMAKAGYDPRAAPAIWKRVADKKGNHDKSSIFSTHPSDWDRYEALNRLLPYAMREYARSTGSYPPDYRPPAFLEKETEPFDWRKPPKK